MNLYICGQKAFGAAVFKMCIASGYNVLGVSAPLVSERDQSRPDRLRAAADDAGLPVLPSGMLNADRLPPGVDVIVAAHSHDFIGRATRFKAAIGAIGYHPSLLPMHRGRDAVRWTIKMGDRVAGGSIYWLSDNIDAGDLAAQDYCFIEPGETPESLWRAKLFPMGIRLFEQVLSDLSHGEIVAVPQERDVSTWEPSWDRQPLIRPDRLMIGSGLSGYRVTRDAESLHR